MKITNLGHRSKRRMKIDDCRIGGAVLKIGNELFLYPAQIEVEFSNFGLDEDNEVVLISLDNGATKILNKDTPCGLLKNVQIGFYEDEVEEWVI
jgi:hypothetical protein